MLNSILVITPAYYERKVNKTNSETSTVLTEWTKLYTFMKISLKVYNYIALSSI